MVGDDIGVTVGPIHDERTNPARIAPSSRAIPRAKVGCDMRIGAINGLSVFAECDHVPTEERLDIEIVRSGGHEEFRITTPAHTFIALRTVGGHFKIVSL